MTKLDRDKIQAALREVHNTEQGVLNPNGLSRTNAESRASYLHNLSEDERAVLRRALNLQ